MILQIFKAKCVETWAYTKDDLNRDFKKIEGENFGDLGVD